METGRLNKRRLCWVATIAHSKESIYGTAEKRNTLMTGTRFVPDGSCPIESTIVTAEDLDGHYWFKAPEVVPNCTAVIKNPATKTAVQFSNCKFGIYRVAICERERTDVSCVLASWHSSHATEGVGVCTEGDPRGTARDPQSDIASSKGHAT